MAEDTQKLVAQIEARYAKAEKEMAKFVGVVRKKMTEAERETKRAADAMERATAQSFNRMQGYVKSFIAAYLSIRGIQAFGRFIGDSLEAAASIRDVSEAANASTAYLQQMRYAASQTGTSAEVLDDAVIKLNKSLGDFRNTGAGSAKDALEQLGLASDVMAGKFATTDEAMDAVLAALSKVPSAADRAALASDLFGKAAGPKLAQLVKAGEGGIKKLREEAERLGLVLSDEMIAKADDASDKLNQLWQQMGTIGVKAVAENADAILDLAKALGDSIPTIVDWTRGWAEWLGIIERTPERIEAMLVKLRQVRGELSDFNMMAPLLDARMAALEWDKFVKTLNSNIEDPWTGEVTVTAKRRPREVTGRGGDAVAEAAAKSAEKARKAYLALEEARVNWRLKPENWANDMASLEGISDGAGESGKGFEHLNGLNNAYEANAPMIDEARAAWRNAFSQFVDDLRNGDIKGAFVDLFQGIADSMMQRATDVLADQIFDLIGSDTMTQIFGPAEAAQYTLATAANVASNALYRMAAAAGTSGGGGGWFGDLVGSVLGSLGGGGIKPGGFWKGNVFGGMRENGGPVTAGTPYIVGEKRPELFVPNQSGRIVPRVPSVVARGGGLTYSPNVVLHAGVSPEAVRELRGELDRQRQQFALFASGEKGRARTHVSDLMDRRALRSGSA